MTALEEGQIQIHTENIFPIIKKAVYSDHEIFMRELVSNGVDAITKRRMASMSGECKEGLEEKIDISIDREKKTLTISDNGIGMTTEEIKKYINQVAFSSAEHFLEKYKQEDDQIIGHFGLGFYSCFMVANNVELITLSALEGQSAVKWSCDGSPKFSIDTASREEPGTDIILYLSEEDIEYLEPSRIKNLIRKYCDFMPIDIKLEGEVINKKESLWRKNPKDITDKEYIDFYNYLYPFQGDPLLWVHLKTDYPYNLQGILFFPKLTGRADWEKGDIKLFCNQVFVSDSIKEVVPKYLLPLRGVLDSPDIPLNVSRSALQSDRRVKSIGNFVSKKVADNLKNLKSENPKFYAEVWDSIAPFVKIGAMEDEKFAEQVSEIILFGTTAETKSDENSTDIDPIPFGEKYFTTIKGYLSRTADTSSKKVIYCTDEISQANTLNLWVSQGNEVIKADTVIDAQFIPWLESKNEDIKFQRVDSEIDDALKEEEGEGEDEITGKDGETKSERLRSLFKDALNNEKITVQVQALKDQKAPPALILLPEQMRRMNDIGALIEQRLPGLPEHHVLMLNRKHSLIEGVLKLQSGAVIVGTTGETSTDGLSKEIASHIYDMARLAVGGLEAEEITQFQIKASDLMSRLMERSH